MGSQRFFLKFGDIKGEVTEPAYRSWIELKSWGEQQGGAGTHISCTKDQDSTTPVLLQYCAQGRTADAVIDAVRESGGVSLRIEISDALISGIVLGSGHPPMESVDIAGKINHKFEPGTPPP
jgi:type VI protein secretion system component Hcp